MPEKSYNFDKSVSLIYQNDSHRGPGKVVHNLKSGLEKIGVSIHELYDSRPWKYTGCLQFCWPEILTSYAESKRPILMGPNLFVTPADNPSLCKLFNHFVVPSEWVKNFYQQFDLMSGKNIHVWPVGIDTDEWNLPDFQTEEELDCFIYFKNRSEQDLAVVEAICRKFNLKYEVIKYGNYQEEELKHLCAKSKFCVLLTGTESQGIAYMQILSTNTPCYVFNSSNWKSEDGKYTVDASSVPYFDEQCGYISNDVDLVHFEDFIGKCTQGIFHPRNYILNNHTLVKSAKAYFDLLTLSYNLDKEDRKDTHE